MILDDLIEQVKKIEAPRLLKPILIILLQRLKELEEQLEKLKSERGHIFEKCNHVFKLYEDPRGNLFQCEKCGEEGIVSMPKEKNHENWKEKMISISDKLINTIENSLYPNSTKKEAIELLKKFQQEVNDDNQSN